MLLRIDGKFRRQCQHDGCEELVPQGNAERPGKWHYMRAAEEGWFFQKNGDAWCPDHNPSWVEEWRRKRAKNQ